MTVEGAELIMNDLERLVAIDQIRDLMARYARYADGKQWGDLARLFLPGGTFQPLDVEGNPLRPVVAGRDEIAHAVGATVEAPAGFTFLSGDAYPPGVDVDSRVEAFPSGPTRSWFNPVYVKAHRKGGHFVPWENPDAVIDDIRATFRGLR
jgi:hypothetical protein